MRELKELARKTKQMLPSWDEINAEAEEHAAELQIGQTLFCRENKVTSEVEYKRRAKEQGWIMTHAHIGLDTWERTKRALLDVQDEMDKRDLKVDRFGLCLDRGMGYPPEMRASIPRETGPRLTSPEEWIEVGQVVPIQPHAGDFMIGFPASMINTEYALRAGITTVGNLSQYFAHEVPGWHDEIYTAVETAKALRVMGRLRDKGTLVHSYLDDGFGALFHDYADIVGWAYLERYIVEDLFDAELAHCFGGVTVDPLMRVAWVVIMREIHGDDCLGSMWYGDTISFGEDFEWNLGLNAEYLLWDMMAQLVYPTGHAVLPLPVTEAVRIPTAQEIASAHVFARRVEEAARRMVPYIDFSEAESTAENLIEQGELVFQRALTDLREKGVDVDNPLELMFLLKQFGPREFERRYGAGSEDSDWPAGRKPFMVTDVFSRTLDTSREIVADLPESTRQEKRPVLIASTDVHAHALFIIEKGLVAVGLSPVNAGSELDPMDIAELAEAESAAAIIVATYNGMALEVGKALRTALDRKDLSVPVFMGGRLNQAVEGEELPVSVSKDLTKLSIIPCETILEMLRIVDDMVL
jgi:methylmalonyl-CoA mutase cobalamin-binding subunit